MKAMLLEQCALLESTDAKPLVLGDIPLPHPSPGELLIRVKYCGVCHTEIDEIEGRTRPSFFPIIPGHQIIGIVEKTADPASKIRPGTLVGLGWIYATCGNCFWCRNGKENLCERFKATGRDANGGYAEYMTAGFDFVFSLDPWFDQPGAATLFCAGAVGYRALGKCALQNGHILGFSGFGASAQLLLRLVTALYPQTPVFVFARSGAQREHALALGARWAGGFQDNPPEKLDAIIDTTPVWEPLIRLLPRLKPGGKFVINAIRKEDHDQRFLTSLTYEKHLWLEKEIITVANICRDDIRNFLALAKSIDLRAKTTVYPLEEANRALQLIKKGDQTEPKVLAL